MLYRKRAWDIMRSDYPSVKDDATIGQVIEVMNASREHYPDNNFVLVMNKKGKFLGGVSMWNIIRAMGPDLLKQSAGNREESSEKAFRLACQLGVQRGITKIIQKDIPMIKPNDTLARIIEVFLDYRQGRAIVEEGEKIMGVVMMADVYSEIAGHL